MGSRVRNFLNLLFSRSLKLNALLSTDQHVESVVSLQKINQQKKKKVKTLIQELAIAKARMVNLGSGTVCDYYPGGNNDFLKSYITALEERCGIFKKKKKKKNKKGNVEIEETSGSKVKETFPQKILFCVGEEGTDGYFLLGGTNLPSETKATIMTDILEGRGGGKSYTIGKFKVKSTKILAAQELIQSSS